MIARPGFLHRVAARGLREAAALPDYLRWQLFRLTCPRPAAPVTSEMVNALLERKESHLTDLLRRIPGGRFLEIGIGCYPNLVRHGRLAELEIQYLGCDLASVCALHQSVLEREQIRDARTSFCGNARGSYVWTLLELVARGEQFDAVYLDGHHTYTVDLAAMALSHHLLRPGAFLMIDDIEWTLDFLRGNMQRSFGEWKFSRDLYSFADYTPEQLSQPQLKRCAEVLLLDQFKYTFVSEGSSDEWWLLRKPD